MAVNSIHSRRRRRTDDASLTRLPTSSMSEAAGADALRQLRYEGLPPDKTSAAASGSGPSRQFDREHRPRRPAVHGRNQRAPTGETTPCPGHLQSQAQLPRDPRADAPGR